MGVFQSEVIWRLSRGPGSALWPGLLEEDMMKCGSSEEDEDHSRGQGGDWQGRKAWRAPLVNEVQIPPVGPGGQRSGAQAACWNSRGVEPPGYTPHQAKGRTSRMGVGEPLAWSSLPAHLAVMPRTQEPLAKPGGASQGGEASQLEAEKPSCEAATL
jgi:hypothetical protein